MTGRRKRLLFIAPLAIVGLAVFIFIGGEVVQYLWNWLLPQLFGFRQITFWQGLGMLALCRILVGGFGLSGSGRSGMSRGMGDRLADRVADRFAAMTPEEQERFRERLRQRCGVNPSPSESKG